MAEGVSVLSARMRENLFLSDSALECIETESQGSRDDNIERDPNFVEDRFRVDRKKLEQMLQLGKYSSVFWLWVRVNGIFIFTVVSLVSADGHGRVLKR